MVSYSCSNFSEEKKDVIVDDIRLLPKRPLKFPNFGT